MNFAPFTFLLTYFDCYLTYLYKNIIKASTGYIYLIYVTNPILTGHRHSWSSTGTDCHKLISISHKRQSINMLYWTLLGVHIPAHAITSPTTQQCRKSVGEWWGIRSGEKYRFSSRNRFSGTTDLYNCSLTHRRAPGVVPTINCNVKHFDSASFVGWRGGMASDWTVWKLCIGTLCRTLLLTRFGRDWIKAL